MHFELLLVMAAAAAAMRSEVIELS